MSMKRADAKTASLRQTKTQHLWYSFHQEVHNLMTVSDQDWNNQGVWYDLKLIGCEQLAAVRCWLRAKSGWLHARRVARLSSQRKLALKPPHSSQAAAVAGVCVVQIQVTRYLPLLGEGNLIPSLVWFWYWTPILYCIWHVTSMPSLHIQYMVEIKTCWNPILGGGKLCAIQIGCCLKVWAEFVFKPG